jgi:hypothetical protein
MMRKLILKVTTFPRPTIQQQFSFYCYRLASTAQTKMDGIKFETSHEHAPRKTNKKNVNQTPPAAEIT